MDFSAFTDPGSYRVVIPGIGCSFDFQIHEDLWKVALRLYAGLPDDLADPALRRWSRRAVISAADQLVMGAEETAFGVLRRPGQPFATWLNEMRFPGLLATAHELTGDDTYLDALARASQFAMGANPLNISYTSGLGQRFAYPMIMDAEYAQLAWPAGIATYGPYTFHPDHLPEQAWGWDQKRRTSMMNRLHPSDILDWPGYELYFRYIGFTALNEFTVQQTMRDQITRWGYLAQAYAQDGEP